VVLYLPTYWKVGNVFYLYNVAFFRKDESIPISVHPNYLQYNLGWIKFRKILDYQIYYRGTKAFQLLNMKG
jgi:hypothetical protein